MMRRIYIYIILIMGLCSCASKLDEFQIRGKDCISITVYNTSMGTKAEDSVEDGFTVKDNEGTERERLMTRLDIFLYPEGNTDQECMFYKRVSGLSNTSGSETVPVYVSDDLAAALFPGDATQCDVYVVANMPDDVTFTGKETVEQIKAKSIRSEEFKRVVASDGTFVRPEKFVMTSFNSSDNTGVCKVTKSGEAIAGAVPLRRAACKITMTILVPAYIDVKAFDVSNEEYVPEVWRPYFTNPEDPTKGIHAMHMGFHKGLMETMVEGDVMINSIDGEVQAGDSDRFETLYTEKFTYKETISVNVKDEAGNELKDDAGNPVTKSYYKYSCDISFYSYPFSWEGQDNDVEAPYFTLMLPWTRDGENDRYTTYYYQVVVNGISQKMDRNYWYDINLNIGVLGSRDYNIPAELEDMSCYILDWSDGTAGLEEDVSLSEWRYLVIPETYIEMNNTDKGYLPFEASHKVAWALEWPGSLTGLDEIEKYNERNKYSAYYINCSGQTPVSVQLAGVNNSSFAVSSMGDEIVLTNDIPTNVYSPIYYHLKVWLDLTPNGVLDKDEESFVERVVFVQKPPIYIIPSQSKERSVYVNKEDYTTSNISYNGGKYVLGQCRGESSDGDHMYVISVSSFNHDDTFKYWDNNSYAYMIGDPRVHVNDPNLNTDGWNMNNSWEEDIYGRKLTYYYPTANNRDEKEPNIFQVISPKFRVASFLGGYSSGSTPEGAAMRCASYQENGYPAGRWRLPTTAEISFVISLQQKGAIQNIFYGGNYYYSSTDQVQNQSTINIRKIEWGKSGFTGSVRCVYDEWYWGSEPEAKLKNGSTDQYEFTWGDAER